MTTTFPTLKQSYNHLSEAERGKIEVFLSEGLNQAEIARRLGRNVLSPKTWTHNY